MLNSLLCVVAAYLIGCISFAILASWMFRLPDPRTYGSGNPGATNVLRSGRKAAALVTLIGDTAKGWIAVALASRLAPVLGFGSGTIAACALAVFLGHLYPVYFGFKGGKGVATALGVLLGMSIWLALAALAIFAIVLLICRYVSAASIAAGIAAVGAVIPLFGWSAYSIAVVAIVALVIWRHRANVQRLVSGTERKIFAAHTAPSPTDPAS